MGKTWLIGPIRPSVPITAVTASSSGMPAATSAPKATTRISSVIGSERTSARLKSLSSALLSALSALASPNCSIRSFGCARWAWWSPRACVDAGLGQVVVAGDGERDDRRAAVLGELAVGAVGRLDVRDVRRAMQPRDDVPDRGLELRVARPARAAGLDQDGLVGALGEVRLADRLVGDARGAVPGVLVGQRLRPDHVADGERDHDEREPAEDRVLRCRALQCPARAASVLSGVISASSTVGSRVERKAAVGRARIHSRGPVSGAGEPHRRTGGATHS